MRQEDGSFLSLVSSEEALLLHSERPLSYQSSQLLMRLYSTLSSSTPLRPGATVHLLFRRRFSVSWLIV